MTPLAASPELYFHRYRFFVEPWEGLRLPPFKGPALRGLFGHALHQLACPYTEPACAACPARQRCVYAVLFAATAPKDYVDARKIKDPPRPYILIPPLSPRPYYPAGEPLIFELVLVGETAVYLPEIIQALDSLGRAGFGGRGRCAVQRVEALGATGHAEIVYAEGFFAGLGAAVCCAHDPPHEPCSRLTLHFITPALLVSSGKVLDHAPAFEFLMRSFVQRVGLLSMLYCTTGNTAPAATQLPPELVEAAAEVRLIEADVQRLEYKRYSNRQKNRLRQGGIVGTAVYQGPCHLFLPYLRLMPYVGIGKSTTFGLGRVALGLH